MHLLKQLHVTKVSFNIIVVVFKEGKREREIDLVLFLPWCLHRESGHAPNPLGVEGGTSTNINQLYQRKGKIDTEEEKEREIC